MTRRQKIDGKAAGGDDAREQRLKQALRANLRRRKDQARARKPDATPDATDLGKANTGAADPGATNPEPTDKGQD